MRQWAHSSSPIRIARGPEGAQPESGASASAKGTVTRSRTNLAAAADGPIRGEEGGPAVGRSDVEGGS
jgi:hypothetical protein